MKFRSDVDIDFVNREDVLKHLEIITHWIDPNYWQRKFKDYLVDTEWVKDILSKVGL